MIISISVPHNLCLLWGQDHITGTAWTEPSSPLMDWNVWNSIALVKSEFCTNLLTNAERKIKLKTCKRWKHSCANESHLLLPLPFKALAMGGNERVQTHFHVYLHIYKYINIVFILYIYKCYYIDLLYIKYISIIGNSIFFIFYYIYYIFYIIYILYIIKYKHYKYI